MEKEAVIEGTATPEDKKDTKIVEATEKAVEKPKRKRGKVWLVVIGIFFVLLVCAGVLVGLSFGAGLLLPAGSEIAKDIAEIPVVDRILPAKTRAEIAFSKYQDIVGDANALSEYTSMPKEFQMLYTQNIEDFPTLGPYEISIDTLGTSNDTAATAAMNMSMDVGGFVANIEADAVIVKDDTDMYFKLNQAPDALYRVVAESLAKSSADREEISAAADNYKEELEEVWYVITADDINDLADQLEGMDFDEAGYLESMQELSAMASRLETSLESAEYTYISSEKIRDIETYKFEVALEERDFNKLLTGIYGTAGDIEVENINVHIWLDKNGYVVKESVGADIVVDELTSGLDVSIENWNFGVDQEIDVPSDAKSVKDLANLFGADVLGAKTERPPKYPVD